ncbi:hypothetical protein D3C73_1511320 [compost metagenome]
MQRQLFTAVHPADGGHIDDPAIASSLHRLNNMLGHKENALQVGVHDPVPFLLLQLLQRTGGGNSGIVHQDVDFTPVLQDGCDGSLNLILLGHIAAQ